MKMHQLSLGVVADPRDVGSAGSFVIGFRGASVLNAEKLAGRDFCDCGYEVE